MNELVAWFYVAFIGVLIPYAVIKKTIKAAKNNEVLEVPKLKLQISAILTIAFIGAFGIFIGMALDIGIFPPWQPKPLEPVIGSLFLVFWIFARTILAPWIKKTRSIPSRLIPVNWLEFGPWVGVSLAAGIFEEIVYRGVLFGILLWQFHSPVIAATLASVIFALGHASQGVRAALFIFVLALSLHWVVWYSASLYTAMIAHAAYDALVGVQSILAAKRLDSTGPRPPASQTQ